MKVGSLFSGIGGMDLGLERAGMEVIWQSEIDPYASKVLEKHWPDVPNLGDVTKIEWESVERPDIVCGGFPCPPFSSAGKRQGTLDDRWLWPEFARCLRVLRPRYVLVENVPDIIHFVDAFGEILRDLHILGFNAEWSVVSACSVGAPHLRRRMFLVAYPSRSDESNHGEVPGLPRSARVYEPGGSGGEAGWRSRFLPEPSLDRVAHGLPRRVVRPQLAAIGNAVVPQVAELVGRRIVEQLV